MNQQTQGIELMENNLVGSIRGYNGYQNAKYRKKSDKCLREYVSNKLKQMQKSISNFELKIQKFDNQSHKETLHQVTSSLEIVLNSLLKPSYINTHFFNDNSIKTDKLNQLYEYDISLKNYLEIFSDEVKELESIEDDFELDEFLNHLFDLIDGLNQTLSEREFLIMGCVS